MCKMFSTKFDITWDFINTCVKLKPTTWWARRIRVRLICHNPCWGGGHDGVTIVLNPADNTTSCVDWLFDSFISWWIYREPLLRQYCLRCGIMTGRFLTASKIAHERFHVILKFIIARYLLNKIQCAITRTLWALIIPLTVICVNNSYCIFSNTVGSDISLVYLVLAYAYASHD